MSISLPSFYCHYSIDYWIGLHRPWDSPLFDIPLRKEYCDQIKYDILQILRWILIPENLTHLKPNTLSESIKYGSSISSYNIFSVSHFSNSHLKMSSLGPEYFLWSLRTESFPMDFITQAPKPTPMEHQKGKDRNDRVIYWSCHSLPHSNFGRAVFSSMILLWFQFSCISCNHLFSTSLTGLVKDLFLVFKRFTNPLWVLHPAHHNKFFSWIMWQWHLFLAGILINTGIRGGPGNRLYKMDFRIGLISIIVENISNLSLRGNSTLAM